ncbi:MAG: hypothetical protein N3D16_04465 [Anaerolineales bacterium]|nr:hypothetical protein [Anaerolineales bacterium]
MRSESQGEWKVIRPPHEVSALALQGNILWAGGEAGVVAIDRVTFQIREWIACDPAVTYVQALLIDDQDHLWIGHPNGLSLWDGATCKTLTEQDGLPDKRTNALFMDRQGRIWIGSWGGATLVSEGEWRTFNSQQGLAHDMVNVIYQDQEGTFWFGSYVAPQGGLSICSLQEETLNCRVFTTESGLPHNNVTSILQDRAETVWVGTGLFERGGAAQFVQGPDGWQIHQILTKEKGLAGMKVRSIYQDAAGALWFGSEYEGLACWEDNRWAYYGVEQGLSNPEVKVFLADDLGNVWLGTADGITYIPHGSMPCLPDGSN